MSKTADFAHAFASNLPIEGVEWSIDGKTCHIEINNDDINSVVDVKMNITKVKNKAEIWSDGHFIGQCSAENQNELSKKLIDMIVKTTEDQSEKQTLKEVNKELCDYLTGEFERNGFEITNKASSEARGSYVVKGQSGNQYQVEATYQDSKVIVSKIDDNRDSLRKIGTFELSNPEIEKVICEVMLEYDSAELTKNQINNLKKRIKQLIINNICSSEYEGEWDISCEGDLVTCETEDERHKIKFRVKDIVLEKIK